MFLVEIANKGRPYYSDAKQELLIDPITIGVFGKRVSLRGVGVFFTLCRACSLVCKPRVLKFGTQLKMDKIFGYEFSSTLQLIFKVDQK